MSDCDLSEHTCTLGKGGAPLAAFQTLDFFRALQRVAIVAIKMQCMPSLYRFIPWWKSNHPEVTVH